MTQPDALMPAGFTVPDLLWFSGVFAFLATLLATPVVIRLAHRQQWVAKPRADRWHEKPTALMGGIAMYAGAGLCLLGMTALSLPWSIWLGATIMFVTGLVDDLVTIRPLTKLAAQVVAAGVMVLDGFTFGAGWPVWASVPVTFLWLIGVTNALNLLDNMDGLAAGIAGVASLVLAILFSLGGDLVGFGAATALAGATAGFLVFNFKPARIFMGDSGSLFLGYMIAGLSLLTQSDTAGMPPLAVVLVSALVLAIPIFDTTLVTIVRKSNGRAVSQGGRDHSSHRLVFLGLSERRAVVTLYAFGFICGMGALGAYLLDIRIFYGLALVLVASLVTLGIYLGRINVYGSALPQRSVAVSDHILVVPPTVIVRPEREYGERALLYGAGDAGVSTLQELRQHPEWGLEPIGFIDDDPLKLGTTILGLPVVGSFRDLHRIISAKRPGAVLITAFDMTLARRAEISAACAHLGVPCRDAYSGSHTLAEQANHTMAVDF
ncbi:MAG: hypothetical protein SH809_06290 [Rhodothermales bacterium]|nr:hypothetical protein [Rhodothermales bacterium]